MKHSKYIPPSACDDDGGSSTLVSDHGAAAAAALKEMAREQSLVTQLRAVMLPALQQAGNERSEVVAQMFDSILDCSAKAIAALKLHRLDHARADDAQLPMVDDKKSVRKISNGCSMEEDNAKRNRRRKRRRLADDSVRIETPVPHYDGHQWRKYGQKLINNTKHPRSYYRCTYKQDQECRATKTVQQQQQQQQQDDAADDTAMYAVVYYGQHTCKPGDTDGAAAAATAVKTASTGHSSGVDDELARSDKKCSSISVTCTSVVTMNHHYQSRTTSLESNCKLLDMAEDVITAEVNKDELFDDMADYTPLDFDTVWRWMRMDMDMGS